MKRLTPILLLLLIAVTLALASPMIQVCAPNNAMNVEMIVPTSPSVSSMIAMNAEEMITPLPAVSSVVIAEEMSKNADRSVLILPLKKSDNVDPPGAVVENTIVTKIQLSIAPKNVAEEMIAKHQSRTMNVIAATNSLGNVSVNAHKIQSPLDPSST